MKKAINGRKKEQKMKNKKSVQIQKKIINRKNRKKSKKQEKNN